MCDSKEKREKANGWNAIRETFDGLYRETLDQTKQYSTLISWMLGGPDPLDTVRIYDGGDYWHFVTFGLSELFKKESENKDISGYGMEFTFKLKKDGFEDEEKELRCIVRILQDLARLTFHDGEIFQPYEYVYTGQEQGIDTSEKSAITGFITIPEPKAERIDTPFGEVMFVELIGAADSELQAIMNGELTVKKLYEKLGTDITDYGRESTV